MSMRNYRDIATLTKRSLLFYLLCASVFVEIAATVHPASKASLRVEKVAAASTISSDIDAFKETGAEKSVSERGYDVDVVIDHAKSLMGTPHVMGGYSRKGIDCSGLVKIAFEQVNIDLPRSSHDQAKHGKMISPGQLLKRGDIVFFHSTYKKNHLITHTGIYIGNNEFIHTSSKRGVTISRLDANYYTKHYLFATRLSR